ncbi:TPA: DUF4435 domain-containing protein [Enterococcus faecalis]|uniref:DUF4435 domain-containing protein n=1 Tax=Enterococcus faecalis TaxID=1351 RepID=UPI000D515D39|nr:DUF4435 domain-containing protein [Enterococcus faecalis]EHA7758380.1 DUF4435 domain-containing protein [Enterococcus faecalis]EIR3827319.1 DUF4435 domain-containing protein [Enterococcus faecalis]EKQ3638512.1 DUF4435 domain-containing protein [Enterococcus faecalis]MBO6439198.1 DUF4435 domain-containing protein [Enterococcus faecalis]MBO6454023.1 DUF4435 domain-containing protein [Enterococcus faecalis]
MEKYITSDRIANAIRMLGDSEFEFFVVLEGKIDQKIYPKCFKKSKTNVQCGFGYANVVGAIEILEKEDQKNVIGLIDSDFKNLLNENNESDQIFLTDYHDIESIIINSGSLNVFFDMFLKDSKSIRKVVGEITILEYVYSIAKVIGILRLINYVEEDKFGMRFRDKDDFINYSKMINVFEEKIIDLVLDFSNRKNTNFILTSKKEIMEKYEEHSREKYDELQLVNGHDLMNLLKEVVNKILKKDNSKLIFRETVDFELILCMYFVASNKFKETKMYKEIEGYMIANSLDTLLVS